MPTITVSSPLPAGLPRAPYAVVMGVTGDWAFTAGTLLQALRRHNPCLTADYLLYTDGTLPPQDAALLRQLGATLLPLPADLHDIGDNLTEAARRVFSPMSLVKFACFSLLTHYTKVLWLDTDILVQDNIENLFNFGALALAQEDPAFTDPPSVTRAGINTLLPVAELDPDAANCNSGVMVFDQSIPSPHALQRQCIAFMHHYGNLLRYPDQAIFNIIVQQMRSRGLRTDVLPQPYNMHPRNATATYAPLVHTFGAYKVWNDGLTATCFPEWQRDYARWLRLGGTPYQGPVDNAHYLASGAFHLISGLYTTLSKAEQAIDTLRTQLQGEHAVRARLEALLRKA